MPALPARRESTSPSPRRRRAAAHASASRAASPVPPRTDAYADYLERRRGLLGGIADGLDEHVRRMEGRARDAVAHAAAVAAASRAQERECLAAVLRLEERVSDLQRTKRACAAELEAFQATAAATRGRLTQELAELRAAVEAARLEAASAQAAQRHHAALREAEERRHALAETQLREATAKVEARFEDAVAALQVEVEARKCWADAQCAMHERRVREAAVRAEQDEFSAFLRRATHDAEAQAASPPAAGVGVTQLLQAWQREAEALATSAAARIDAIVERQRAAASEVCEAQPSAVEVDRSSESWGGTVDGKQSPLAASGVATCREEASATLATEPHEPHAEPTATASPQSPRTPAAVTEEHAGYQLQSATASANVEATPSSPSPSRVLLDTPVKYNAQAPTSPQSSLRRHGGSPAFPERKLIKELYCSTDAFVAVSTPHK